jgi:hypothetical protein
MGGEEEKILALEWGEGDPLEGVAKILRHGGKVLLARRGDGACLFLNEGNGLCRIHEQFGFEAKPLGCRVFPYQIAPTFSGEATVIGRFDCPTVRKNVGATYEEELPTLRKLAGKMGMSGGFDEATTCHLEKEQIQGVCDFISTMMMGFKTGEERALFIVYLCEVLAGTDVEEITREGLAGVYGGLRRVVENGMAGKKPGWFGRMGFRVLLGLYLRRDEDVLVGKASRLGRVVAMGKMVVGGGGFRGLGVAHRGGTLKKARLFKEGIGRGDAFGLFWRMVKNRLESFQFMGAGNQGRDFLSGLRSLAMLYPLVVAVAKYSAGNRGASEIGEEDVEYGVMVIEHSFGRLRVLKGGMTGAIERLLMEGGRFGGVVRGI